MAVRDLTLSVSAGLLKAMHAAIRLGSHAAVIFPRSLKPVRSGPLSGTAYLDALRGYAAWFVYNHHLRLPIPYHGFAKYSAVKMFNGPNSAVDVFFVISGFTLSYSTLGYIHSKDHVKVLDSLGSSIFRRYIRMYLPCIFATFIAMLAIASGVAVNPDGNDVLQPTLWANIRYWLADTVRSSDPFAHVDSWYYHQGFRTHYLFQMWTIPVQFRASILVYICCAAVCKMDYRQRIYTILVISLACMWWEAIYGALHLAGMIMADRRQLRAKQRLAESTSLPTTTVPVARPSIDDTAEDSALIEIRDKEDIDLEGWPGTQHARSWVGKPLRTFLQFTERHWTLLRQLPLLVPVYYSLCLLGGPMSAPATNDPLPFSLLAWIIPPTWSDGAKSHLAPATGSVMLMYSLELSPLLQRPFVASFSQYLGELSFGIYAMHNTVRWIVWEKWFVPWQAEHFGPPSEMLNWVPGYLVMTVLVLWAAELFRMVDMQCVRVASRLQRKLFAV
ncbi:unnamed protein product [Zymoseptoria tritici ST99CH_3D7]|uniref:Acyltransferase 3 domain-containing protein n=1 Tax=Zymoseptoria tritici (strain ST99CH_3D7) TaxID=1276538 RepID=A0A1X7RPU3_ZYMT9|nr:unnamed protein product [Zymoseptoria tritici ST99CH_3D7]